MLSRKFWNVHMPFLDSCHQLGVAFEFQIWRAYFKGEGHVGDESFIISLIVAILEVELHWLLDQQIIQSFQHYGDTTSL